VTLDPLTPVLTSVMRASTSPTLRSHAHATSNSSQASVPVSARATNNTLKLLRSKSWLLPLTLSTIKSARPTAANALRLPMPPSPFRQRTEPLPSKVPSLSLKEFTSLRERDPLRTPRASHRRRLSVLPTIRTVASVLINSALPSKFAPQASMLPLLESRLAELPHPSSIPQSRPPLELKNHDQSFKRPIDSWRQV